MAAHLNTINELIAIRRAQGDIRPCVKIVEGDGTGDFILGYSSGALTFDVNTQGIITAGGWQGNVIGTVYGGTGQSSYTDGELLIGCSSTGSLSAATLTAGTGIMISNGCGSVTINAAGTLQFVTAPVNSSAPGTVGQVALSNVAGTEYLNICIASNSWGRVALTTSF